MILGVVNWLGFNFTLFILSHSCAYCAMMKFSIQSCHIVVERIDGRSSMIVTLPFRKPIDMVVSRIQIVLLKV